MFGLMSYFLLMGVTAGFLARLLLPGPNPVSYVASVAVGALSSLIGGVIGNSVVGPHPPVEGVMQPSGVLGSAIGVVLALSVFGAAFGRVRA
jgi:uncharacterized membrane protein YeaQ/YmgE (transglycosylase-associated protein family)